VRIENPAATAHARIGWLRSVNNIQHQFAAQSFVAELAHAAKRDHRDFLFELLGPAAQIPPPQLGDDWNHGESPQLYPVDTGRLRGVIERVTKEAGWGRKLPRGQGLGLAANYSFVTYMAVVVEVRRGCQGRAQHPAHRRRRGLRPGHQPGPHPLPDRRCLHHGPEPCAVQRDHVQGRARRAEQLP
jgi:isoquinoline 1-oxidoreductase beta subunit